MVPERFFCGRSCLFMSIGRFRLKADVEKVKRLREREKKAERLKAENEKNR